MKTKYNMKVKINNVDVGVAVNMKDDTIKFSENGTTYHFTKEEKMDLQKKIRKLLQKTAEEKFKR